MSSVLNSIKSYTMQAWQALPSLRSGNQIDRGEIPPANSASFLSSFATKVIQQVSQRISRNPAHISTENTQSETTMSQVENDPSAKTDPISEMLNFKYRNSDEDYFHDQIATMVREVKFSEFASKSKEQIRQSLSTPERKWTIPSVVGDLLNFKEEFPELFEKRGYQQDLDYIQKELCEKYDISKPTTFFDQGSESYSKSAENLNAKEFQGGTLILGCGPGVAGQCGPHDPQTTFFVSYEKTYNAHIQADYYSHEFWKELPENNFKEVFFEGFCPNPRASSLKEICRILQKDGKARIYLSGAFKIAQEENCLEEYLKACGFTRIELVTERFRSCGEESDYEMIHAYK